MPIERIHSFLVHPGKNEEEQVRISGTTIPHNGALFRMLSKVYDRSIDECDIPIMFRKRDDGVQQNPCRDLVVAYGQQPTLITGKRIAARLQSISTRQSGQVGLLFLMKATEGNEHVILLSRFPADQGVVVQERAEQLDVEFIERVFMKNAKSYKSARYSHQSFQPGSFWKGAAVDLQISGARELSDYWISEFLDSILQTTSAAGSKRLAVALMGAIKSAPSVDVRSELVAAAQLMRGQNGRRQTAVRLLERVGLSDQAVRAIADGYPGGAVLMEDTFEMNAAEFQRFAAYRAVELDNGGLLVGEDARFEEIFNEEIVDAAQHRVRYRTEGNVVNETLRKLR